MHKSANMNLCSFSSCGAGSRQCIYHLLEVKGVSIPQDTSRDVPKASKPAKRQAIYTQRTMLLPMRCPLQPDSAGVERVTLPSKEGSCNEAGKHRTDST